MSVATLKPSVTDLHAGLMQDLKDKQRFLAELIGPRRFYYVDIPVRGNIGDLLIMHGTLAYFRNHHLWPKVIASAFEFSPAWVGRDEVIVFHGGGNFGDLYAGIHSFRENVVAEKTGNRIVILPQTVHFSSLREQRRSARVFREHPDLHFCVRDERSVEIALHFSDHVYLVPDMAHQLFPIVPSGDGFRASGTLLIRRVDDEKGQAAIALPPDVKCVTDWPELVGRRERRIEYYRKTARWLRRTRTARHFANSLSRSWVDYSGRLIEEAVSLFASHDRIVTDRLHAHILACLMSKPNTVLDNSYGKNHAYLSTWTAASELVQAKRNV
ncbi:MAG TPA: polysaccharide pyruvyl transferase family protein [Noviherbaspirillum sp.]|nr:polysaccharide pyruvyl transferase family protein [Noviherbaspirillum sp.]